MVSGSHRSSAHIDGTHRNLPNQNVHILLSKMIFGAQFFYLVNRVELFAIINNIFTDKLLVTTGSYKDSYENGFYSEVIDIDNENMRCNQLPNSAYPVQGAAGGLVGGKPMICGGFYETPLTGGSNKCFILGETHPIIMESERSYPSSISISRDQVSHFD